MYNFYIFYIERFKALLYLKDVHENNIPTINCTLEIAYTASITFDITETSGYPLVYCSVGDYSCGTRGCSTNPVSIASELNGKTINCNTGDKLLVAAQTTTDNCVDLLINGDGEFCELGYNEQNWCTVVEGPQTLTIKTYKNKAMA